jgi:hypothetical protein
MAFPGDAKGEGRQYDCCPQIKNCAMAYIERAKVCICREPFEAMNTHRGQVTQGISFFISSTSDLTEERQAARTVIRRLFHSAYDYQEETARRESPETRLATTISLCEALVGIVGPVYGSPVPERDGQGPTIAVLQSRRIADRLGRRSSPFYHPTQPCSIVEWEFHVAYCCGLEMMPFVKQLHADRYSDPRQQEFVGRLQGFRTGLWCNFFSDADDFVSRVEKCILIFAREQLARSRSRERVSRVSHLITLLSSLVALATFGGEELGIWSLSRHAGPIYLLIVSVVSAFTVLFNRLERIVR